jgi:hypothetical protein
MQRDYAHAYKFYMESFLAIEKKGEYGKHANFWKLVHRFKNVNDNWEILWSFGSMKVMCIYNLG